MYSFILGLLIMMVGLLPHVSLAQLDLEEMLNEPTAVAAETAETSADTNKDAADVTETVSTEVAPGETVQDEANTNETIAAETKITADETVILPEDVDEKPAETVAESETSPETTAPVAETMDTPVAVEKEAPTAAPEDDFMAQYIDEISEQEQENSQAREMRSNVMQLIMQKDNTAVLSADDANALFERSAKIREEQKKLLQEREAAETASAKPAEPQENTDSPKTAEADKSAPFGLTWGASQEDTAAAGFELEEVSAENMTNIFLIKNPRQKRAVFDRVTAVFGAQNHLYAIYAQTPAQEDMPNAEKALKLYHDYYTALEKKYGNAAEHYSPNKEHSQSLKEVGYDLFLQDLKEDKAFLFATFSDDTLKITLSVLTDDDAHSYIALDYENTRIQSQEKEENLNDLINDL